MGAWTFVEPVSRMGARAYRAPSISASRYAGRPASASTATGLMSKHLAQLQAFLDEALGE